MNFSNQEYIKVFKALCDDKRLSIISLLQSGESCACVIADKIDVSQSALSYHMKILTESGIVASKEEGKWTYYQLSLSGIKHAELLLSSINCPSDNISKDHCQTCK